MKRSVAAAAILTAAATLSAPSLGTPALAAPAAAKASSAWGHVSAPKQTIKDGCRPYRFHYAVDAPGDAWMSEFTLVNPRGRQVSTRSYDSSTSPASGTGTFDLCQATTTAGRYTIRMKVTSYDDRDATAKKASPGTLRLVERR